MHSKKALVVDSNPGSRELLRVLLEHEGYQAIEARNSREALELNSSNSPDLILIDLQMPLHEGYTTAEKLRHAGRFKKTMVALTGRELDSDTEEISAAGFSTFISKPIVLRGLHDHLAQLLHQ